MANSVPTRGIPTLPDGPSWVRGKARSVYRRVRASLLLPSAGAVVGVHTERKAVALTFDDGPNPTVTPTLLDLFERHGARATHFMVGALAERHPALVAEVVARGHAVANHTYTHPSMATLDRKQQLEEVRRGEAALGAYATGLFRPPYGHLDVGGARAIRRSGMELVTWRAHVRDWEPATSAVLAERLRKAIAPGNVVLLHEALYTVEHPGADDRGPLLEALDEVLGELAGAVAFVTVPELLELGPVRRKLWEKSAPSGVLEALEPGLVQRATG